MTTSFFLWIIAGRKEYRAEHCADKYFKHGLEGMSIEKKGKFQHYSLPKTEREEGLPLAKLSVKKALRMKGFVKCRKRIPS